MELTIDMVNIQRWLMYYLLKLISNILFPWAMMAGGVVMAIESLIIWHPEDVLFGIVIFFVGWFFFWLLNFRG